MTTLTLWAFQAACTPNEHDIGPFDVLNVATWAGSYEQIQHLLQGEPSLMGLRALLLSEELIDGLPQRSLAVGGLRVGQHDSSIQRLQLQLLLRQSLDRIVGVGTSLEALPFPTFVPFDFPVTTGGVDLGTLV